MYVEIDTMDNDSRVWIFQADRIINENEINLIKTQAKIFTEQWASHDVELKSSVEIYHNLFLVIAVDDKAENPGGCSIDSMTGFIRETGKQFGINFFDRLKVVVENKGELLLMSFDEAGNLAKENPSIVVYDSLVSDMRELRTNWKKKFVESWHMKLA
jgi:hypothetical protein